MMQSNVTQSVKLARSKARRLCYRGGVKESGVPWVVFGNRREGIVQHVDIHAHIGCTTSTSMHNPERFAISGTIRVRTAGVCVWGAGGPGVQLDDDAEPCKLA